ncbi:MAG TPA: SGNH/GDSL hydrolase family protein [Thermoflexales bacterium]|nr:SGNH/GDSL hydrolase family protein [Thermoflexales bacterium]
MSVFAAPARAADPVPTFPENAASSPRTAPNWIPAIAQKWRAMYARAAVKGRDPRMFTVAGDSNSEYWWMMHPIANGQFDFSQTPDLRAVAQRFAPSFNREDMAAKGGFRAAGMFLPELTDKKICGPKEGLYECELRVSKASVVFILVGTGDHFQWREYEGNLRRMVDTAIALGVVPVLSTKADDLEEWQGGAPHDYINSVIRRVAAAYGLPLIDLYAGTRGLPVVPNPELPNRPFTKNGLLDEWGYYFHLSPQAKRLRTLSLLWVMQRF